MTTRTITRSNSSPHNHIEVTAREIILTGQVQGVGFRPFVYRMAHKYHVQGWVKNDGGRVSILAQGSVNKLEQFERALITQAPEIAKPVITASNRVEPITLSGFTIRKSTNSDSPTDNQADNGTGQVNIHVPPDYFLCSDCWRELRDANDRRYQYPFINCTQCGPRYTLIKRLPYDRLNTSMAEFTLCAQCQIEYLDPLQRRFHAEPIACPACGPQLQLFSPHTGLINHTTLALQQSVELLRGGAIVAVKGIGGYHLMCDATNDSTIKKLRQRKPRPHKPLAIMFPLHETDSLAVIQQVVHISALTAHCLLSPARPIVLAPKKPTSNISEDIAPGLDEIGVLLPYSPLHALLLQKFNGPLVATSANISDEPVMTDNHQAQRCLINVADAFLHHNRSIERPADDSVQRIIAQKARPLRLGRGITPLELILPFNITTPTLATGGHMKNSIALAWENRVVISPHIGDLQTPRSAQIFQQVIDDLQNLYQITAQHIVCDAHPGYAGNRWAKRSGKKVLEIFHHHAHASAVAGEFAHEQTWLVFTWDGTGFGADGTLWGGETFFGTPGHWQRVASHLPFFLPGGDKAGREPWRSAMALCWQTGHSWQHETCDTNVLFHAWKRRLNTPQSTAMGRLFDAAAALTGICTHSSYEGHAPMLLESNAMRANKTSIIDLPFLKSSDDLLLVDWSPLVTMLTDKSLSVADKAATFHYSVGESLVKQTLQFKESLGDFAVGLNGGVFQNKLLTEYVIERLRTEGIRAYLPEQLPCNDGGLCYGQIIETLYRWSKNL